MYCKLKSRRFICTLLWECTRWPGTIFCVVHTIKFGWAGPLPGWKSRHSSGHRLVEAVLATGKAVWDTILLLKLSGPAEPHNNPLLFKARHWGIRVRLLQWQLSLSYAIRTFKILSLSCSFMFLFSSSVLCVCVYVCIHTHTLSFFFLIQNGLGGNLQAGTKRCRLKSQLWPSCG